MFNLSNIIDFNRIEDTEYLSSVGLKKMVKDENNFIIKYDKKTLCNLETIGLFRSVVIQKNNIKTNTELEEGEVDETEMTPEEKYKILSFAPPKSLDTLKYSEFIKDGLNGGKICYQEFIDGTMINVYYDKNHGWELATRSIIGGKSKFFKVKNSPSFRDMFIEALNNTDLEFDDLDEKLCYSFVLQHPKNRIVLKVENPKIYLCSIYECQGLTVKEHDIVEYMDVFKQRKVCMPVQYNFDNIDDAIKLLANPLSTPYYCMGVVLKHTNGMRWKVRNPNYEYVRGLRGNDPKNQFQYFKLRQSYKLGDFILYYPEFYEEFKVYEDQVFTFTKTLHELYMSCFIKKEIKLSECPYEFKNHLYVLHKNYLNSLSSIKEVVTPNVVNKYISTLEPARLMYSVNYKYRPQKEQTVQTDKMTT